MTNNYKVPDLFVKATFKEEKEVDPHRWSVTELLLPSYMIRLSRKHKFNEDVRDKVQALLGTAFHKYMEDFSNHPETKLEVKIDDINVIVGIIDDYEDTTIIDYKTVNVSKVQNKDFKDNELQIKIYAYLMMKQGKLFTKGRLHYLMKDWKKIMVSRDENYPASPIYTYEFDITTNDLVEAEKYVKNKINEVENETPLCTDEERWFTGNKYAVYKKTGDAKASKVCNTEEEAHQYITEKCNGAGQIEVRKGQYLRCDLYCGGREFCERFINDSDQ